MDKASEALFSLKQVTFRYKKTIDQQGIPQFGLIAEEVEKVNPDLVICDPKGKPYTVRYEQINAMLLNEFLKEHHKVEEQAARIAELRTASATRDAIIADLRSTIAHQQKGMEAVTARLDDQALQIQRVNAEVELTKPVQPVARIGK